MTEHQVRAKLEIEFFFDKIQNVGPTHLVSINGGEAFELTDSELFHTISSYTLSENFPPYATVPHFKKEK
jgi:hypothetical protein